MIVAFVRLELRVTHSKSLKDRRRVMRSLRDKVKSKFDVRVAEVGGHDTWQSLEIGFASVGTDSVFLSALFDKIVFFIEREADAELVADYRDSIYYGDDSELATAHLDQLEAENAQAAKSAENAQAAKSAENAENAENAASSEAPR